MSRRIELENGAVYEGAVMPGLDVLCGAGKMTYADGSIYEGEWKDDMRWGRGRYTAANGDVYDGEWTNDKRNGLGVCEYADGMIYNGNWMNDKKDYKGKLTYNSPHSNAGDIYEGRFKDDKKNGVGKYTSADGCVYDGNWKEDKRSGAGKLYLASGEIEYEGEWENDKPKKKMTFGIKKSESSSASDSSAPLMEIPAELIKSYDELKNSEDIEGIDKAMKEMYLSDEEFVSVFEMSKADFLKKPKWQRDGKKKEVGLF